MSTSNSSIDAHQERSAPLHAPQVDSKNTLLDRFGPLAFAPFAGAILWPFTSTPRLLLVCGSHMLVSVWFIVFWNRLTRHGENRIAQLWAAASGFVVALIPWVAQPSEGAGTAALAFLVGTVIATDIVFVSSRQVEGWRPVMAVEVISVTIYLTLHNQPFLAGGVVAFTFTMAGGHQTIRELLIGLVNERELSDQRAQTDELTGLPNRRGLKAHVAALRDQGVLFTCYASINIDNFKQFNDRLGQVGGDAVLADVARRIPETLGDGWFVARSGGDEFCAIGATNDTGELERLRSRLSHPVSRRGHGPINLSMGVAWGPPGEDVWNDAMAALRLAKKQGKNQLVVVDEALRRQLRNERDLAAQLADALVERQIIPWAQPIVDTESGRPVSFECLARWPRQDGTTISPTDFIPLVEDRGLAEQLGESMLAQIVPFARELPPGVQVSVNITAGHFESDRFIPFLSKVIADTGLDPRTLIIEVTESQWFTDEAAWITTAERLRNMGIGLAIDDFGTGFSTLDRILKLPLTHLKLDQSLVHAWTERGEGALLRALSEFARTTGVALVAEGVDTTRRREALLQSGVPLCQGYLFGPAVPLETALANCHARMLADLEEDLARLTHEAVEDGPLERGPEANRS